MLLVSALSPLCPFISSPLLSSLLPLFLLLSHPSVHLSPPLSLRQKISSNQYHHQNNCQHLPPQCKLQIKKCVRVHVYACVLAVFLKCGCVSVHPQNVSAPSLSHCLNSAALIRTGLSIRVCVCVSKCVHVPKSEYQCLSACACYHSAPMWRTVEEHIFYSLVSQHIRTHTTHTLQ